MTNYRLFPATNGPASAQNIGPGNFIAGVCFTVSTGSTWFEGYWWWVAASLQSTAPVKCALWSASPTAHGGSGNVLVPGSVVTSGTLTAGQWNYIPLSTPLQLSPGLDPVTAANGGVYIAAIGLPTSNANFPDTNSFWGSRITQGPLVGYASGEVPYSLPQGVFTQGGSDPSVTMPNGASGTDNFWVDVQISDQAPVAYPGSYRIWPNKFDGNSSTGGDAAADYTIATEVDLQRDSAANFIHYFIPNGMTVAAGLATAANVWSISSGLSVVSLASPSWTTESGGTVTLSAVNGQWVKAAIPGGTILPAGKYRVSVYNANGTTGIWGAKDATTNYWQAGVGASGITQGPVTAPNQANAQLANFYPGSGTGTTGGQPVFQVGPPNAFPNQTTGTNPAQNYWIDLEVTPEPSAALTVTPALSAVPQHGHFRTATLTVAPRLLASRSAGHFRAALLQVIPRLLAIPSGGKPRGERQLVRLAVATYFGGQEVLADRGTCFQGGPLTAYGLGTAYPYSVKGVPDEYYTAGQPDGQNYGVVMSTTKVRRVTLRDSYGGAASGWRMRKYAIDCRLELICELPHIEVAGAALDDLIDQFYALIAADRNLGTRAAYNAGTSPLLILQAGEGKGGQGGPGIDDETEPFEEIDHDRGRYRGTATVNFECLTMVVG